MTSHRNWRRADNDCRLKREAAEQLARPQQRYFTDAENAAYKIKQAKFAKELFRKAEPHKATISDRQAKSASRNRRRKVPMTLPTLSILKDKP